MTSNTHINTRANINECKLHCSVLHGYCLKVPNKTPESAPCAQVFTICPLCSPPLIFCLPSLRSIRYRSRLQNYPPEALLRQQPPPPNTPAPAGGEIHPLPFSDASHQYLSAGNSPDREEATCDH